MFEAHFTEIDVKHLEKPIRILSPQLAILNLSSALYLFKLRTLFILIKFFLTIWIQMISRLKKIYLWKLNFAFIILKMYFTCSKTDLKF